jgi:hypothetical protein
MESRKFHDDKVMTAESVDPQAGPPRLAQPVGAGPRVSVVILSEGRREELVAALNSAMPLCQSHAIAVSVVVESEALSRHLQLSFPAVQFLMVSPGLPEEERRTMALRAAGGDLVVFARESGMLNGGWREALGRQAGHSDEPAGEPSAEWARRLAQLGVPGALGDI